jgi:hypothetical protein
MSTTPPATGPQWATDGTSIRTDITNTERNAGFAVNQPATAGWFNQILYNLGQWINYLAGPRGAYTSLQSAAAAMAAGDTVTIYENDSATIPGDLLTGYRSGDLYAVIAASSDVVIVADGSVSGTVYVYARGDVGGTALRTIAQTHTGIAVAMAISGNVLAVAYGHWIELFTISTGASLWAYDHGANVADVQISGGYVALAGAVGTGSYSGRLLTLTGTLKASITHGAALTSCAIYGRNLAFAGIPGTGAYNLRAYRIGFFGTPVSAWNVVAATGGTLATMRTDGRNIYVTEVGHAYCLSWADGSQIASADILLATVAPTQWMVVDQGGVCVLSTDGATVTVLQRLALGSCSVVWQASVTSTSQVSLSTDGARIWSLNPTGSSDGILTFARGNCAGTWTKIDTATHTTQRFGWLLVPGVE